MSHLSHLPQNRVPGGTPALSRSATALHLHSADQRRTIAITARYRYKAFNHRQGSPRGTCIMDSAMSSRRTTGIVNRIEPNGDVFVHEVNSRKLGFLTNTTPVEGHLRLKPGMLLSLDVEDRGNVMVVSSARAA
jgi:hypothetical protein